MDGVLQYLRMGGYAAYVWSAYGVAAMVLAGLVWQSVRSLAARKRELAAVEAALPPRTRRRPASGNGGA